MRDRIDWSFLARFFAGECTAAEKARVEAWRVTREENEKLFQEIMQTWEATRENELHLDVQAAWYRFEQKRQQPRRGLSGRSSTSGFEPSASDRSAVPRFRPTDAHRARRLTHSHLWAAGAAVAAVLLAFMLLFRPSDTSRLSTGQRESKVFVTRRGQRAIIDLTDGSRVRLNVDSRLTVSANFVLGKREVYLEGEAQFAVASDTSRPFIVRTSGVEVEVVGTVFGVRAYEDDERTEVAVAEGEVVFRPSEARAATDTVVLRENHLGIVSGRLVQAERDGVVIGDHLGWTDGRLVFSDAPFDEVIRRLERWYDLDIELEIPSAAIDRLNATFEREPLDQVLGEISLALRLRYRKRGEAIIFYRQPDSA